MPQIARVALPAMKLRRSRLRLASTLALTLGLALGGAACDKEGGSTDKPGGKNGSTVDSGKPAAEGGKDYVYAAEGFVLTATMNIKFEISSKQGSGAAEIAAKSLIEATPAGADKLEIHGKVIELINFKGSGQLDPEFMKKQAQEQGGKVVDIVEQLGKSESWLIVNLKGELDEAATKALPQNKKGEDDDGADFGLFNLPDLPAVDLVEGKKVTLPTKTEERQLPFGSVPVEIDETWTLRKIDGNRIAEFDVTSEGSGATEISGGGGSASVSMLEESSFTIFFNLETKLPVSFNGYSQSETSIDIEGQRETITFSTNNEISATYEPGAPG
jgi:predicted RecA/RadA family phage recombinase